MAEFVLSTGCQNGLEMSVSMTTYLRRNGSRDKISFPSGRILQFILWGSVEPEEYAQCTSDAFDAQKIISCPSRL